MIFNKHSEIKGYHAFLSPSKYHWINYDPEKLDNSYLRFLAIQRGTELHEFAHRAIKLGKKMPDTKDTFNLYVNDAIGYRMVSEQPLFYSLNCFGTADAISFRDNFLRIHDLKTGETPVEMHQLEVYAAIFCLEYDKDPRSIGIELRVYQKTNVLIDNPHPDTILRIMDTIVAYDRRIEMLKKEERWDEE